ncbi:MAG: hypothetical protein KGI28_02595 [Thaumarchaeota archaeon]|nr:hypothetical protein [Nitrososphaerota archaeon]
MDAIASLKTLGYYPITTKGDKVILDATLKTLKIFGQSSYAELLEKLRANSGMSEIELIKNFHLFEEALKKSTGQVSAKVMLDMIKEDLIRHTNLSTVNYKIDEIIEKVEESGVYDFIRTVSSFEHILVLYKNQDVIDRVLGDFFGKIALAPRGLVSKMPTAIKDIRNITYAKLSEKGKEHVMKKLGEWIEDILLANVSQVPAKVADEDCTWYIRNGFGDAHLKLESSLGLVPNRKVTLLCAYDMSQIPPEQLESIIKTHGYVLVENSTMALYENPNKK